MKTKTMKRTALAGLMIAVLTMSLFTAAYASSEEPAPVLEGTYSHDSLITEIVFTFDADGGMDIQYFVGGFEVYSQEATYALNDDETEITVTIPLKSDVTESEASGEPESRVTDAYTSTFSFDRGQHGIVIGGIHYEVVLENEAASEEMAIAS